MGRMSKLALILLSIFLMSCGSGRNGGSGGNDGNGGQAAPPTAQPGAAPSTLTIFAAASLSDAFKEIGAQFQVAHPGIELRFNFAGSDQLAQQIVQGAPADVFASANSKHMNVIIKAGEAASGSEQIFARNRLVLIYPHNNPAQLHSLADLSKPGIKIILAHKNVPAGAYALDFLAKASQLPNYTAAYSQTVLSNVVSYEENVRAVLSKVALGEADAGIVYTTDAASIRDGSIGILEIPDALNALASYPIVTTAHSHSAKLAQAFVAYVLSPEGQNILKKYGFIPG